MEIYYDTEFIDDGERIRLLSFGAVRQDGQELYLIVQDEQLMKDALKREWLKENVVSQLPVNIMPGNDAYFWDEMHPDYPHLCHPNYVRHRIQAFITNTPNASLWAWYAAYDHVVMAQQFGPMIQLPAGIPMYTHDLRQEADRLGVKVVPSRPGTSSHNALDDAKEVGWRRNWLREYDYRQNMAIGQRL